MKAALLAAAAVALAAAACRPTAEAGSSREPPHASAPADAPDDDEPCPAGFLCDRAAFATSPRPAITEILVQKQAHRLHLVAGRTIVRTYSVALGGGGMGQKRYEGDGVTPIGTYHVTAKRPSRWHTFLALDYPSDADRQRYADLVARGQAPAGRGPGSAIGIHGHRAEVPERLHKLVDWTLGCVALDDDEIDEIAAVAPVGTKVVIEP